MASQIMVANETTSRSSRMTKDGRKITYQMNVIQQPERARACGSGAKSSADRRPVDPPPIVELRIYEGEAMQNDITFAYNANFFLFATLENARNIAQGRVPASNTFPVLTGTPVAGMAYLDRPNPAGYFIFPDLSVRHEGKYRLSFALYEELKEQKDMDNEQDQSQIEEIRVRGIDAHVSHRLEVKSAPFTVFSAKKFPGLTESTALSRMVAEQGCRVRIRRDVRMRRRDNKSKDWDDYDGEDHYERARRTATPDGYGQSAMPTPQAMTDGSDRPRSVSNASIASFGPPQRRPSMQEMAQAYQQGGYQQPPMPPPHTPQSGYSSQIPYGTPQTHQYQNQYTPTQQQPPMMPPHQPPYQPPQHAYQQQPQPQMPLSQGYGYVQQQQYSPQDPPHAARQDGMEYPSAPTAYRRASGTMLHPPQHPEQYTNGASQMPQPVPSWSGHQNPYNPQPKYEQSPPGMPPVQAPPQQTSMAPATTSMTLPSSTQPLAPLKTLQPVMEKPLASSPYTEQPPQMPMSWAPEYGDQNQNPYAAMRKQTAVSSQASAPSSAVTETTPAYNQFPPPKFPSAAQQQHSPQQYPNGGAVGGTKRSFASTFDTNHVTQPLRQGARPDVASAHSPTEGGYNNRHGFDGMDDDLEDNFVENAAMSYRRADGTERRRRVPLTS